MQALVTTTAYSNLASSSQHANFCFLYHLATFFIYLHAHLHFKCESSKIMPRQRRNLNLRRGIHTPAGQKKNFSTQVKKLKKNERGVRIRISRWGETATNKTHPKMRQFYLK